jgi:hypothetical protein
VEVGLRVVITTFGIYSYASLVPEFDHWGYRNVAFTYSWNAYSTQLFLARSKITYLSEHPATSH